VLCSRFWTAYSISFIFPLRDVEVILRVASDANFQSPAFSPAVNSLRAWFSSLNLPCSSIASVSFAIGGRHEAHVNLCRPHVMRIRQTARKTGIGVSM
jgi:hypothetical protein